MHSGVKYLDRNNSQPPTIIIRQGSMSDILFPTDYVKFNTDWERIPIIQYLKECTEIEDIKPIAASNIGKKFQILMPLKAEDQDYEYIFIFQIKSYKQKQIKIFDDYNSLIEDKSDFFNGNFHNIIKITNDYLLVKNLNEFKFIQGNRYFIKRKQFDIYNTIGYAEVVKIQNDKVALKYYVEKKYLPILITDLIEE